MIKKIIFIVTLLYVFPQIAISQDRGENKSKKYIYWSLLQLIPSPSFFNDGGNENNRLQFGFKWNITPINFSFHTNKFVSPFQFFIINPVRRFTGSAELFIQPEITTSDFKYSNLRETGISSGTRLLIPLKEDGENLACSIGIKYSYKKDKNSNGYDYCGIEAGIYVFAGMVGLQYTQNFNSRTKYNFTLYIKYF
jgi:hypothetical protein